MGGWVESPRRMTRQQKSSTTTLAVTQLDVAQLQTNQLQNSYIHYLGGFKRTGEQVARVQAFWQLCPTCDQARLPRRLHAAKQQLTLPAGWPAAQAEDLAGVWKQARAQLHAQPRGGEKAGPAQGQKSRAC
jgi:hypothetical protein